MKTQTRSIIAAAGAALAAIGFFAWVRHFQKTHLVHDDVLNIGFILDGDGSTPYTANFIQAANQISAVYGDRVSVMSQYNVPYDSMEQVTAQFAEQGCDMIVTNSYGYGEAAKRAAEKYPEIEFCEATCDNANQEPVLSNYHNFMGEIYQGRYVCGAVAGLKISEMISEGVISEDQAVVGYVAAFPVAEVISGYTAFFLGVRSQCPSAVMKVKYTNTWTSFVSEKKLAEELIDEGCVIIAQHSDTIGPAIACEKAEKPYPVYHVGYNQDMIDAAPTASLISTRIDWSPYLISAVEALLNNDPIEQHIAGNVHGQDAGGGFREGWVRIMDINTFSAAEGSAALSESLIAQFRSGSLKVFQGDYVGVDPNDPSDTYDLSTAYPENAESSAPSFHYILRGVITEE